MTAWAYHFTSPQYIPGIAGEGLSSSERGGRHVLFYGRAEKDIAYMNADTYGFCRYGVLLRFPESELPPAETDPNGPGDRIAVGTGPFTVPANRIEYRGCDDRRWRRLTAWPAGGYGGRGRTRSRVARRAGRR